MAGFDRTKFNTDPALEGKRTEFDQMVEDSVNRLIEKKKKEKPNEPGNFFDELVSGIFGSK